MEIVSYQIADLEWNTPYIKYKQIELNMKY